MSAADSPVDAGSAKNAEVAVATGSHLRLWSCQSLSPFPMLPERSKPKARYTGSRLAVLVSVAHVSSTPLPAVPGSKPPIPSPEVPGKAPEPPCPSPAVVVVLPSPVDVAAVVVRTLGASELCGALLQAAPPRSAEHAVKIRAGRMVEGDLDACEASTP